MRSSNIDFTQHISALVLIFGVFVRRNLHGLLNTDGILKGRTRINRYECFSKANAKILFDVMKFPDEIPEGKLN